MADNSKAAPAVKTLSAVGLILGLLLGYFPTASNAQVPPNGPSSPVPNSPPNKNPKLDSSLSSLAATYKGQGRDAADEEARAHGLTSENGNVRVEIEMLDGDRNDLKAAIDAVGGIVEGVYADLLQALLPVSALE